MDFLNQRKNYRLSKSSKIFKILKVSYGLVVEALWWNMNVSSSILSQSNISLNDYHVTLRFDKSMTEIDYIIINGNHISRSTTYIQKLLI